MINWNKQTQKSIEKLRFFIKIRDGTKCSYSLPGTCVTLVRRPMS